MRRSRAAALANLGGVLLALSVAACRSGTTLGDARVAAEASGTPQAGAPTTAALVEAGMAAAATSTALPVIASMTAPRLAPPTTTPLPTEVVAGKETAPAATGTLAPTATATPQPTFTPPPMPPVAAGEHLIFPRPVPAGGPSWTDKSYPYGSTRGGTLRPHTGVEFVVPTGTPIEAVAGGTVVFAGSDDVTFLGPQSSFYGNAVVIEHQLTESQAAIFTLYGHLSEVLVATGQVVEAGDVIGLSGESGVADGPHLHFEVRAGSNDYRTTRNPLLWLEPLAETGVVLGRVMWPIGERAFEVPVSLVRVDAPATFAATTTYAQGEPNSDAVWDENFAVDDLAPGYYAVSAGAGDQTVEQQVWVFPGRITFVDFTLAP